MAVVDVLQVNQLGKAFTGQRTMGTWSIVAEEFISDLRCDLRGHLEPTRALEVLEAMKVVFRSNMHMDSKVVEVTDFKSEANFIALSLASL